eukprot:TRINITY_DN66223_c3_g1_i1.p1 TRINITY_DN66223_c3_g1~~TRINITY_DN66223_c3_g1_i1.p1  ORF type:complete len:762 (+),score=334.08 TRINITY_DN66223_c3_g1_i1:41-2326(+)
MSVPHWVIGVVLAACAAVVSNLGLNLQKMAHIKRAIRYSELINKQQQQQQQQQRKDDKDDLSNPSKNQETIVTIPLIDEESDNEQRQQGDRDIEHNVNNDNNDGGDDDDDDDDGVSYRFSKQAHQRQGNGSNKQIVVARGDDSCDTASSGDESPEEYLSPLLPAQRQPSASPPNGVDVGPSAVSSAASVVRPRRYSTSLASVAEARDEDTAAKQEMQQPEMEAYTKDRLWIIGLLLITVASFADFAALGFGAQSIIAPLGSLTLVCNIVFAHLLLGETLTTRDVLATLSIVAGSALSVAFASHQNEVYPVHVLFAFYKKLRFIVYAVVVMGVIGVMSFAIRRVERLREMHGPDSALYRQYYRFHRFSYAALSGIIGAQSVLMSKCTCELLLNTFAGRGFMFFYWESYLVLGAMVASIFYQIKWLNDGLRHFDAMYVVPVFQSFWIVVSVAGGLVFFGEYATMGWLQAIMFPTGIMFTIIGVVFLSKRSIEESAADASALLDLDDEYDAADVDPSHPHFLDQSPGSQLSVLHHQMYLGYEPGTTGGLAPRAVRMTPGYFPLATGGFLTPQTPVMMSSETPLISSFGFAGAHSLQQPFMHQHSRRRSNPYLVASPNHKQYGGVTTATANATAANARRTSAATTPVHHPVVEVHHSIDPHVGFQGLGAPATFTPSMMGRCAVVYTVGRRRAYSSDNDLSFALPPQAHHQTPSTTPTHNAQPKQQQYYQQQPKQQQHYQQQPKQPQHYQQQPQSTTILGMMASEN